MPNFKNISANFRDLAFDPGNKHSVPFNWGTTGLIVRSDLVQQPITRWADLWDERLAGKIAMRPHAVEITSIALKSLGYPLTSEEPAQLAAAQAQLQALKPKVLWVEVESPPAVERLLTGEAAVLVGWPGDALYGHQKNGAITYVQRIALN